MFLYLSTLDVRYVSAFTSCVHDRNSRILFGSYNTRAIVNLKVGCKNEEAIVFYSSH